MDKNENIDSGLIENKILTENKNDKNEPSKITQAIIRWLTYRSKSVRFLFLFCYFIFVIGLGIVAIYFCWFQWLSPTWKWGFEPLSFKALLSVWGCLFLCTLPLAPFGLFETIVPAIFELNSNEIEVDFQKKIKELENQRLSYEEKLSKSDTQLLIPLITYSKIELETYYKMGLKQTQTSYKYSVISMWIGFLLIVCGIVIYVIPIPQANQIFVSDPNLKALTISAGIIIELISVLFLWIYKNSIKQITYFYNRQINIHNALFAFRISETMEKPDDAKKIIIERILQHSNVV